MPPIIHPKMTLFCLRYRCKHNLILFFIFEQKWPLLHSIWQSRVRFFMRWGSRWGAKTGGQKQVTIRLRPFFVVSVFFGQESSFCCTHRLHLSIQKWKRLQNLTFSPTPVQIGAFLTKLGHFKVYIFKIVLQGSRQSDQGHISAIVTRLAHHFFTIFYINSMIDIFWTITFSNFHSLYFFYFCKVLNHI